MPVTYAPFGCNCVPAYNAGADDFTAKPECIQWRTVNCGRPGYDWEYGSKTLTHLEQVTQGSFSGCNWSGLKANEVGKYSVERGCYIECAPGYTRSSFRPEYGCYLKPVDERDNFGQALLEGTKFAVVEGVQFYANPIGYSATKVAQAIQAGVEVGGGKVGIDLGGIFGGVASALGGLGSGSYLGALSGVGQIASAFVPQHAPQPVYAMPSYGIQPYSPPPVYQQQMPMQATPVGAFGVAGRAIATLTAPILAKIAVKLGLRARPSLTRAMDMVRKAAKLLTSPEAVAAALGITVGELATLITTSNARKRRRMNPANSKALRRAARRIKSFHRLCTHTDVLKNRSRRSAVSRCGTCKKAPCRC